MNLAAIYRLYDFEGARSYLWPGIGPWIHVRTLPRVPLQCVRWIARAILPNVAVTGSPMLVAVLARDGRSVFGYGLKTVGDSVSLSNNFCFTCFHLDPTVAVAAGGTGRVKARVRHMAGGLDDLRARFAQEGF
ncbi:MAG: hypothetical protein PHR35_02195 [Kiritimatiellae bacterium]|nr:hypothetical protein [Kiritimatiellia bacterium]